MVNKKTEFKGKKYRKVGLLERMGRKLIGLSPVPPEFMLETSEYEEYLRLKFKKELGLLSSLVITRKRIRRRKK